MQTLNVKLKAHVRQFVDTVLPPRCVITGEEVLQQGYISPAAFLELSFIAAPYCACCGVPFDFKIEDNMLCASCLAHQPDYDSARAALVYNDRSRDLILGFKHADKTFAVKAFAPWLIRAGADILHCADYLVPVPLHPLRLIKRRYNQAALMAQDLSRHTDVPVLYDGLKRIRATQVQGHMHAKDRRKNVRKAFVLPEKHARTVQGKTIVIVDDVLTTGATVNECTKVLKAAGAAHVHVLTLARVVYNGG